VTSPALYRYFDDRTAILEALAVEAREQLVPPPADLHWEDWVREAAARERALWRTHPDLYESARYRAISAPLTRLSLAGLRVLIQAGFTAEAALAGMTVTSEIAHSIGQAETKKQDPTYLTEEEREEFRTLLSDVLPMSFDRLFESSLSLAIEGMRSTLPRKKR
jgi:AcrR family transcriptional regulator